MAWARADRVRLCIHRPSVARHPDRLAARGRRHEDLRREDLDPGSHPARAGRGRRPSPGNPRLGAAVTIIVHEHKQPAAASSWRRSPSSCAPTASAWSSSPGDCKASTTRPASCYRARRDVVQRARVHPRPHPGGPPVGPRQRQVDRRRGRTDDGILAGSVSRRGTGRLR